MGRMHCAVELGAIPAVQPLLRTENDASGDQDITVEGSHSVAGRIDGPVAKFLAQFP